MLRSRLFACATLLALGVTLAACQDHLPTQTQAAAPRTTPARTAVTAAATQSCTITRVADGDSLDALCKSPARSQIVKIRLRGIDAPELQQAYGASARQRLNALCLQQTITLPLEPEKDRYGRVLADVRCKNQDAGEHMVRGGQAWFYRGTAADYPQLVQMEAQAKRQKLGLWGDAAPTPPWVWRQQRPR